MPLLLTAFRFGIERPSTLLMLPRLGISRHLFVLASLVVVTAATQHAAISRPFLLAKHCGFFANFATALLFIFSLFWACGSALDFQWLGDGMRLLVEFTAVALLLGVYLALPPAYVNSEATHTSGC